MNTPYTLIFQRRCLQSTGLFPRGQTLFHFPLIIILEFDPHSKIILRQSQNLSLPNFFIDSSKCSKTNSKLVFAKFFHRLFEIFYDNFKTCLCQISSSTLRNVLRRIQSLSLPKFLIASLKYSKTISKLVFAKFLHRLFEMF